MMYFIFWVVFLLVVILSVPIVNFLENRKRKAARGPVEEELEEQAEAEGEGDGGEVEFAADEEMPAEGGEFAEFEEIR